MLIVVLVMAILVFHVISSIPGRHRLPNETFVHNLQSPTHFLFCAIIVLIIYSPIWVYRRKVPKEIHLENGVLHILSKRHKKSLTLPIERISYFYETHLLYCTLDIYLTVETSRGHTIKPLTRTIIVPSFGMVINAATLGKLVTCLKDNGVEINTSAKPRSFWDIIAN